MAFCVNCQKLFKTQAQQSPSLFTNLSPAKSSHSVAGDGGSRPSSDDNCSEGKTRGGTNSGPTGSGGL
ncbi:hypothetical protein HanRHA438_Chr11g0521511 [Helianthus annuus]|nr:hypothetical protein HanIR_Chr11g0547641 [Helianthus annuus]KAJ0872240.1 hypothetical protein HanRHA438_Chr11g0521511 [Helianthus annuus]